MIIVASIIKKGHYHVVNKGGCVASIRTYGLLKKIRHVAAQYTWYIKDRF